MDEKLIKELIRLLQKTPEPKKKALLIVTGASRYLEFCTDYLVTLELELNHCLSAEYIEVEKQANVMTKLGDQLHGAGQIEQTIRDCDFVLIPDMTTEFLTKGALCLADNDGLYVLQQALLTEKKVIALFPDFLSEEKKIGRSNNNYRKMFAYYQEILERLGVKFVEPNQLDSTITTSLSLTNKKEAIREIQKQNQPNINSQEPVLSGFITYEDVVNKTQITLTKQAKLTELAKDHIMNNQIKINYSN